MQRHAIIEAVGNLMRCTPSVQIRYALKPRFRKKTHLALHVHGGLSFQTSERTCAIKRSPKDNSRTIGLDAIIWHFQRIWTQTGWWTHMQNVKYDITMKTDRYMVIVISRAIA